jgi:hypothetical protein
MVVRVTV